MQSISCHPWSTYQYVKDAQKSQLSLKVKPVGQVTALQNFGLQQEGLP